MKLILHIGTEKTGTTSIQRFLKLNRIELAKYGYYVPESSALPSGNHRWITLTAYEEDRVDDFIMSQGFKSKKDQKDQINERKIAFISECDKVKHSSSTVILSSEHFQSRLKSTIEIQRLKKFLDTIFSEITIVIYIRDPLKTAVSLLSTAIKQGATLKHLPPPNHNSFNQICNHQRSIERWRECFPNSNIIIRRFDKDLLEKHDVVMDFCKHVIPNLNILNLKFADPINETLSLTGMALIRRMNLLLPRFVDGKVNRLRGGMPKWISSNTNDGTRFLPCVEEFHDYRNFFHTSNENIRSEYFPSEEFLFPPQKNFSSDRINLEEQEIPAECYERLILFLWKEKRQGKMLI